MLFIVLHHPTNMNHRAFNVHQQIPYWVVFDNEFSVAIFCNSAVKQIFVPMSSFLNVPISSCPLCSDVLMFQCPRVLMSHVLKSPCILCSHVLMSPCPYVLMSPCPRVPKSPYRQVQLYIIFGNCPLDIIPILGNSASKGCSLACVIIKASLLRPPHFLCVKMRQFASIVRHDSQKLCEIRSLELIFFRTRSTILLKFLVRVLLLNKVSLLKKI